MAQPSGRVCGLPAKYGVYLRSSPIICAADTSAIVLQVLSCCIVRRVSLGESIRIVMHERFRDDEGLEALRKATWLRWIFFILGTLGSAVKILAMKGVPWTKIFGVLFLASFLILEVLILVSWKGMKASNRDSRTPNFKFFKSSLFLFACFLQGLLFFCAIADLWPRKYGWFGDPEYAAYGWAMKSATLTIVLFFESCVVFSMGLLGGVLGLLTYAVWKIRNEEEFHKTDDAILWWFMIFVIIVFVFIWRHILGNTIGFKTIFPDTVIILVCFVTPIFLPYFTLQRFFEKCSGVADNLLLTRAEGGRNILDKGAYWSFVMFLYTLVISILWYRIRYNPEGTQDPGWVGVFG